MLLRRGAGLGPARGPVEPGHPVARALCGGDLVRLLHPGPDPPAGAAAPPEVLAGGAGDEPVVKHDLVNIVVMNYDFFSFFFHLLMCAVLTGG